MMLLLRAELERVRSRRMTWMLLLIGVALTGLVLLGTAQSSAPAEPAQRARSEQAYETALAEYRQQAESCARHDQEGTESPVRCDQQEPKREWFTRPTPTFATVWSMAQSPVTIFAGFLGLVAGVSWIAAEFTSGSFATWLTFEPRRSRVFGTKILAVAAGILVGMCSVLLLVGLGVFAIGRMNGIPLPADRNEWGDIGLGAARMVSFPLLTAVGGAAAAFILRHTAAVLGTLIGVLVVDEWFFSRLGEQARWSLSNNVLAFVTGHTEYSFSRCGHAADGVYGCTSESASLHFGQSCAVLVGLVVVGLVVGLLSFRRRDVA